MVDKIRVATNGNFALGSERFQAQVAAELHRVLVDLDRQLAGGGEDQRARVLGLADGQRRARDPARTVDVDPPGPLSCGLGKAVNLSYGVRPKPFHSFSNYRPL